MAPLAEVSGIAAPDTPPTARPESDDPEQLRAENERLRARLSAAETVAQEREQRIEDLLAALRGLPQAWVEHLERTEEGEPDRGSEARGAERATVIEVVASRPGEGSARRTVPQTHPRPREPRLDLSAAEAAWEEVRLLRDRLELRRLDQELERLRTRPRGSRFHRQRLRRAS